MVAWSLHFRAHSNLRWTFIGGVLFATLLNAGFGDDASASSTEDPDVEGDDDLDDDSFDATPEASAVEDFDLTMPEEDRRKQMEACFGFATARVEMRSEELQAAVKENMERHSVSLEQAINSIVFSWMMSCYMNINPEDIREAGKPISEAEEARLFTPNPKKTQQVHQASQRQWELLQSVLMDQTKKKQEEQKEQRKAQQKSSAIPEATPPIQMASGPPSQTGWLYVLVVFGMLFGLGALGVARLVKSEKDEANARQKKKEEKEAKKGKKKA